MNRALGWLLGLASLAVQAQTDSTRRDSLAQPQPEAKTPVFTVSGYVKYLNTVSIPAISDEWTFDNQVHNRFKLRYQPISSLTLSVAMRNRLFFGQSISGNPQFVAQTTRTLDYVRLGGVVFGEKSVLLHSIFDRANVDVQRGSWQVTVGKQRVNWGKSYVWNPNDVFNAYSFFDFDYEERPGTDALLARRYLGRQSSVEVVGSLGRRGGRGMVAALYKFNRNGTDGQLLAGKLDSSWVIGAGWAGQLRAAGFKGELSYFGSSGTRPGTFMGDVSLDYTLPTTLTVRFEALVNSHPLRSNALAFLTQPVTARTLINNTFSVFAAVGYELTPLVVTSLNSIWNVDDGSYYLNPSVNLNLKDNTELLITAQVLAGRSGSLFAGVGSFVFTRLKWSF